MRGRRRTKEETADLNLQNPVAIGQEECLQEEVDPGDSATDHPDVKFTDITLTIKQINNLFIFFCN